MYNQDTHFPPNFFLYINELWNQVGNSKEGFSPYFLRMLQAKQLALGPPLTHQTKNDLKIYGIAKTKMTMKHFASDKRVNWSFFVYF